MAAVRAFRPPGPVRHEDRAGTSPGSSRVTATCVHVSGAIGFFAMMTSPNPPPTQTREPRVMEIDVKNFRCAQDTIGIPDAWIKPHPRFHGESALDRDDPCPGSSRPCHRAGAPAEGYPAIRSRNDFRPASRARGSPATARPSSPSSSSWSASVPLLDRIEQRLTATFRGREGIERTAPPGRVELRPEGQEFFGGGGQAGERGVPDGGIGRFGEFEEEIGSRAAELAQRFRGLPPSDVAGRLRSVVSRLPPGWAGPAVWRFEESCECRFERR